MNLTAWLAIVGLATLCMLAGALLARLSVRNGSSEDDLVESVNARLPQTQCAQCGFPGCRPYAEAVAAGQADINQCPPGGEAVIQSLASLLQREPMPLDTARGTTKAPQVALIDEASCIGCALCLPACPVDAIVGAPRYMHTVIAADCTGCELCLPPCPVDCIALVPRAPALADWQWPAPGWRPEPVCYPAGK